MKQITITVPDNCELKQDGNTYTIIEKEEKLTYEDVARKLFSKPKPVWYVNACSGIVTANSLCDHSKDANNCTSARQAEKLLAINKLMNVAKYLNGDWQPDWSSNACYKYYIYYSSYCKEPTIDFDVYIQQGVVYFKSKELAKKAIEILGEETIKLALCTDY